MFARLFTLSVLTLFALGVSGFQAFATNYHRGNQSCWDFEGVEKNYRKRIRDTSYRYLYAYCLLVKGDNDSDALFHLYRLRNHHRYVPAAYMIAKYTESKGVFNEAIYHDKVNEAIGAYSTVLSLMTSDYPNDGDSVLRQEEQDRQIELVSRYQLTYLHHLRFMNGVIGTHNMYLVQSPNYKGNKNLNTYPEYRLYTLDSLQQVIRYGNKCHNLPDKKYFNPVYYEQLTKECDFLVGIAEYLMPLEEERLDLLNDRYCQKRTCTRYDDLVKEIFTINKIIYEDWLELWRHISEKR